MAIEQTLSIIKPDAVKKQLVGTILARFEAAGFKIVQLKMLHLTTAQTEGFYAEHKGKSFFIDLINSMTSGPIVVQVLEGENVIEENRLLMGATDPRQAEAGTIRADYADSIDANAVHGSDSLAAAQREIVYFFPS